MNIFNFSIRVFVFATALMLGTTAVVASRFVITTVTSFIKPGAAPEGVVIPVAEPERVVDLPDLRNEPPPAPDDFDPSGTYSLDTERVPAAFADIVFLDIVTRQYEEKNGTYVNRPIIPNGAIQTTKSFDLTKIAVGNREISFETAAQNGVSYQFVGEFPVSSEFMYCEGCEYPPDISGRLKKLKNGKVIAEMEAKFYYNGC